MGLFDWFKKKDAAHYLDIGRKALGRQLWVDARDYAREGLTLTSEPETQAALQELQASANREICLLNLHQAELSRISQDKSRALECLDTARIHAVDGEQRARVEALARDVKSWRSEPPPGS